MNELHILFAGTSADNVRKVVAHLQSEGCAVRRACVIDAAALESELQQRWDVLIASPSVGLTIESVLQAMRSRELDIPAIIITESSSSFGLAEATSLGARDCLSLGQLERLLPTIQREIVTTILRTNLREQVVADHLMREIDQLILLGYDLVPLVERICQRMVELFDFKLVWIGARMPDGRVEVVSSAGESTYLQNVEVRWDDTPQGMSTAGRAIRDNKPVTLTSDSPLFALWSEGAEQYGMRSILAMPLGIKGEVVGALMLYSAHEHTFDKLTVSRLSAFAGRVTVAMLGAQEQQELRLMSAAMSNAADAMFITRRDGVIEWVNDALCRLNGYKIEEIIGSTPSMFSSGQHDRQFWREMWASILNGDHWRGDVVNRNKKGELYTVLQTISPLYNDKGELMYFLAVQQDISEKRRLESEIRYLAYHDTLTHLPNRMLFRDRVEQSIAQAKRTQGKLAVLFIDLDGFKAVNDTYGHNNGDRLLEQVAERMRICVRAGDTVARLGGDEFTVLLREVKDMKSIELVAQKLLEVTAKPYELEGDTKASVSFSIGISVYPEHGDNFDALLSHADQSMYEAKQNGKNRYIFYKNYNQ